MAKKEVLIAAVVFAATVAGGVAAVWASVPVAVQAPVVATSETAGEYRRTLDAMKPPKRSRPIVAVLGDNRGTEAIDFLVPYGVLRRSGVADVYAVGMTDGPLKLRPALTIQAHISAAQFDRRFPSGADYVIVPAMYEHRTPDIVAWIKAQAADGATIMAICSGAEILANGGLLANRFATTHWTSVANIQAAEPTMRWVPHRRYVADRGIITTTGVSAAIPASLALVEAIAGHRKASDLARELGSSGWGRSHDSGAYRLNGRVATLLLNSAAKWKHEDIGVRVSPGIDDIALALTADTWSRTYRSRALTLADRPVVRTRYGLDLVVDQTTVDGLERVLERPSSDQPASTLERTLAQISAAYGRRTARLVAIQLEHDPREVR